MVKKIALRIVVRSHSMPRGLVRADRDSHRSAAAVSTNIADRLPIAAMCGLTATTATKAASTSGHPAAGSVHPITANAGLPIAGSTTMTGG